MRILALTNLYPNPFQPNRATFNRHRLRIMNESHPVRVIAPISWTDEWKALRAGKPPLPANRQLQFEGLTVDHPKYLFPPKFGRRWYGHCFVRSVRKCFDRAIEEFRPDILFAPWAYPDGWAAVRLGKTSGLPVVIQCHGSDVLLLDRFPSRRKRTVEAVTGADGVVAVSRDIARNLEAMGVPADRIRVVYDGVDFTKFHPVPKSDAKSALKISGPSPMLLFVGNLVPVKAVDVLLEACGQLLREKFDFQLVIVGDGPLRPKLEAQRAVLGLTEHVKFVGAITHEALPSWFQAADLFVLPSHSEGVPTVLLEASACGTPWVASRVGGIPEIEQLGLSRLVPPNTPSELAKAVRERLSDPVPQNHRSGVRSAKEAAGDVIDFLAECLRKRSKSPTTSS